MQRAPLLAAGAEGVLARGAAGAEGVLARGAAGAEGVRARSSGVSATALCSAAGGGGLLRTRACTHARAWSRLGRA